MRDANSQTMACMEVWGGNELVNNSVSMPGLDAWVYSKPFASAQEGGDVYYVSCCAAGRVTRLLVADVSGHGENVRDTAMVLRDLMRRFVNHHDQRHFVKSMNKKFTELSQAGSFATAVVTTFDGPTNEMKLCNAGHPTPLLYRAKTRDWRLLERVRGTGVLSDIPLGVDDASDYEQVAVQLEVGDLVLCYSDSLIESKDGSGEMLGESGLLKLASEISMADASQVVPRLIEKITSRAEGNLEADDVTVLLFRPNGSMPRAAWLNRLAAPFRLLGGLIRSLLPGGGPPPLPEISFPGISRQ